MIRGFLLGVAILTVLAGCTPSSLVTVDIELLENIGAQSFPAGGGELLLPDSDGIGPDELSGLPAAVRNDVELLEMTMEGTLSLDATGSEATLTVALHISDSSSSPFAVPPVDKASVVIGPGETIPLDLAVAVSEAEHPQEMTLIQQNDFRIGLRLSSPSGIGTLTYELDSLRLRVSGNIIF